MSKERSMSITITQDSAESFASAVELDGEQVYEARGKEFGLVYVAALQYVASPDSVIPWRNL